jgi:hypothetical protein
VCQTTVLIKLKQLHGALLPRFAMYVLPWTQKNGGPKAAAVAEMLAAYAPFRSAESSHPEVLRHDLPII